MDIAESRLECFGLISTPILATETGAPTHGTGSELQVTPLSLTPGSAPSHSMHIWGMLNWRVVPRPVHHATLLQHVNSSPGPDPRRNGPCPSCPGRESVADVLSKSCSCWQIITRRRSISHLRQPAPPSSSYFFCSTLTILSGFTRSRRFLLGGPISCSPDPLFRCGAPLLARPVLARLTSQEAQHRKQPRNARPSSSPTSRALRFSWRERDNKAPMEQDPDSTIIHKNAD